MNIFMKYFNIILSIILMVFFINTYADSEKYCSDPDQTYLENIGECVEIVEITNETVVRRTSGELAARKYNWFWDEIGKNRSGNLRGIIINSKAKLVYSISANLGKKIAGIGTILQLAINLDRESSNISSILNDSSKDTLDKSAAISQILENQLVLTLLSIPEGTVNTTIDIVKSTRYVQPMYWLERYFGKSDEEFTIK